MSDHKRIAEMYALSEEIAQKGALLEAIGEEVFGGDYCGSDLTYGQLCVYVASGHDWECDEVLYNKLGVEIDDDTI